MTQEFRSWKSFRKFANEVTRIRRFLLDAESDDFLRAVAETSGSREQRSPKGLPLFRAQRGHGERQIDEEGIPMVAYPEDRLRPRRDRATEGRANPKGVPVFYSALDKQTAIAEVRPWVGSYVSYGRFATIRELRLVNCIDNSMGKRDLKTVLEYSRNEPEPREREKWVWHDIDEAFSEPVGRDDDSADYVATQILSECFRKTGFDGICFRSSVVSTDGINVVLFNLDDVELIDTGLVKISKLTVEFEESDGSWYW